MEKRIFKTRKPDKVFTAIHLVIGIVLLAVAISGTAETGDIWFSVMLMILIALITGSFLMMPGHLNIIVSGNDLTVRFFFQLYKTDIRNITKVRKGETMWSGFHKYGTATNGLTVFAKFKDDLYITPDDEEEFLHTLLKINPHIIVETVR